MAHYKHLPESNYRSSRPRMSDFDYIGAYRYHIMISTFADQPFFAGNWDHQFFVSILKDVCDKQGFTVIVYCFMPNHLHLLLESGETSNLKEMMRIFKQITSFHYKKATGNKLWQSSYIDRVLRKEEDTIVVARYIVANPVKARIVANAIDYPFIGSFKYSKEEICGW